MANTCFLIGRLTKDPEMRYTQDQKAVANFTLAVNRDYDREKADFIRVIAWGKTAEIVGKYLTKGSQCAVVGSIQTGSYQDKDGKTVYTTDINAQRIEFIGSKNEDRQEVKQTTRDDDYPMIGDDDIDSVPF